MYSEKPHQLEHVYSNYHLFQIFNPNSWIGGSTVFTLMCLNTLASLSNVFFTDFIICYILECCKIVFSAALCVCVWGIGMGIKLSNPSGISSIYYIPIIIPPRQTQESLIAPLLELIKFLSIIFHIDMLIGTIRR